MSKSANKADLCCSNEIGEAHQREAIKERAEKIATNQPEGLVWDNFTV